MRRRRTWQATSGDILRISPSRCAAGERELPASEIRAPAQGPGNGNGGGDFGACRRRGCQHMAGATRDARAGPRRCGSSVGKGGQRFPSERSAGASQLSQSSAVHRQARSGLESADRLRPRGTRESPESSTNNREVEAAIRDTMAQTYIDLALYSEARQQVERAAELHRRVLGQENPKTLASAQAA